MKCKRPCQRLQDELEIASLGSVGVVADPHPRLPAFCILSSFRILRALRVSFDQRLQTRRQALSLLEIDLDAIPAAYMYTLANVRATSDVVARLECRTRSRSSIIKEQRSKAKELWFNPFDLEAREYGRKIKTIKVYVTAHRSSYECLLYVACRLYIGEWYVVRLQGSRPQQCYL